MSHPVYRFADWVFDAGQRALTDPSGTRVPLPPKQMLLLRVLLDHPQEHLSRQFLVDRVYGAYPPARAYMALNVQVSRLRATLNDRADTSMIMMVTGGYWFCPIPELLSPVAT